MKYFKVEHCSGLTIYTVFKNSCCDDTFTLFVGNLYYSSHDINRTFLRITRCERCKAIHPFYLNQALLVTNLKRC